MSIVERLVNGDGVYLGLGEVCFDCDVMISYLKCSNKDVLSPFLFVYFCGVFVMITISVKFNQPRDPHF